MPNIYVNQVNFEFEETPSYHDILRNSGSGAQTLVEIDQTIAHIYVNQINLEIPAVELVFTEFVTCSQTSTQSLSETEVGQETCSEHGTQTIEEVITGTPVPEPEVVVGGGTGSRIQVMGGRPWSQEDLYVSNSAAHAIGEQILIGEIAEAYAYNNPEIETRIRRPIYAKPKRVEVLSFSPTPERTIVIPIEEPKINSRQKEEEELLLLGII